MEIPENISCSEAENFKLKALLQIAHENSAKDEEATKSASAKSVRLIKAQDHASKKKLPIEAQVLTTGTSKKMTRGKSD